MSMNQIGFSAIARFSDNFRNTSDITKLARKVKELDPQALLGIETYDDQVTPIANPDDLSGKKGSAVLQVATNGDELTIPSELQNGDGYYPYLPPAPYLEDEELLRLELEIPEQVKA